MPLYYFHLHDGATISDIEGTNLPDAEAALEHAGIVARELMAGKRSKYRQDWGELRMSVRDMEGQELFQLPLSDFEEES